MIHTQIHYKISMQVVKSPQKLAPFAEVEVMQVGELAEARQGSGGGALAGDCILPVGQGMMVLHYVLDPCVLVAGQGNLVPGAGDTGH